jgi:hypothetical protein
MKERAGKRISLAGAALLGGLLAACEDFSVPNESLTPKSTAIVKPTETLVPTVTFTPFPIPVATNTPEAIFEDIVKTPEVAQFKGFSLVEKDGKWIYVDGKGEYAGEVVEFTYNNEKFFGAVLTPAAWLVIEPGINTSEKIAKGDWVVPMPLDARGESGLVIYKWWPRILDYVFLNITGISSNAKFVSPFKESVGKTCSGNAPGFGKGCDLSVPQQYVSGSTDHSLMIIAPENGYSVKGGDTVGLGGRVIEDVNGFLGPKAPKNTQIIIGVGPGAEYTEGEDMDVSSHIAVTGKTMLFLAAE